MRTTLTKLFMGLGVAAAAVSLPPADALTLVREGQPVCAIVVATNATRSAQFAAFELRWHIRQMTGAETPIVHNAEVGQIPILVGESAATRAMGLRASDFQLQEYLVRSLPEALVLMGRDEADYTAVNYDFTTDQLAYTTWPGFWSEQGTAHAVYDFLERCCGVRWLTPAETGTVIPRRATLSVKPVEVRRAPAFRYRGGGIAEWYLLEAYDSYSGVGLWPRKSGGLKAYEALAYPTYTAKYPGGNVHIKRTLISLFLRRLRLGGELCFANHSLYDYYDRFLKTHPDWFAQGYTEKGAPPQLCYTHPDLIRQVAQDARDYFDKGGYPAEKPGRGHHAGAMWGKDYFSLEPMDNSRMCKCSRCLPLQKERDATAFFSNGEASDYWFSFVNAVAKEVKATHPHKRIVTLAYMTHADPPAIPLDPSVAVQFCFSTSSGPWLREHRHELDLLQAWRDAYPERPLYLWLYAKHWSFYAVGRRDLHLFPVFYAHNIGEQFKRYHALGVRGAYFCGHPLEVDAYVTYKLFDDPTLEVDALLDDYFRGLYGAAAAPLKEFYLMVEGLYRDPATQPKAFFIDEKTSWEQLGTPERMAWLGERIAQARAAAETEFERRNVALFERGTWAFMDAGAKRYAARRWHATNQVQALRVPYAAQAADATNDLTVLDFAQAATVAAWHSEGAEPMSIGAVARLTHDGKFLYASFEETNSADAAAWDLVVAVRKESPFYRIAVATDGTVTDWTDGFGETYVSGARAAASPSADGKRRAVRVAVPLDRLLPRGVEPGWTLYGNLARRAPDGRHALWIPDAVDAERPDWFGAIHLAAAGLPPALGLAARSGPKPRYFDEAPVASNAVVRSVEVFDLDMATDDVIQGKPHTLETPRVNAWFRGALNSPESALALTDASTPRAPLEDIYVEGASEIAYRWDLDPVPSEGRRLETIRLWWSAADGARNAVKVRFAVRDAASGEWRDVTGSLSTAKVAGRANVFRVLEIDVSKQDHVGFDAVRMIDELGSYNPRMIELDVLIEPPTKEQGRMVTRKAS